MVNHNNTVCSNCGSNYASSGWCRTYNKDGSWDRKTYHCARCHYYFDYNTGKFSKNYNTGKFSKNYNISKKSELSFIDSDNVQPKVGEHKNTICSNCGSNFTSSNWYRTYNKDGSWDRNRYHCRRCDKYFNRNTGEFSKISEGQKIGGHEDTVCYNCDSNFTSGSWYKKRDENGNWNGKYICTACYNNPACRSGELNPNSNVYKGMICVETVAKVLGDKDCTIMKEGSPFDICSIQSLKYGKIEVKTRTYNSINRNWMVGCIKPGLFDTLFILCTDSKFKNIFRVYIIDGIEVGNVKGITIYRNPSRGGRYEEFRVDNIVLYQEAFQIIKNENQISKNYVGNGQNSMSNKEKGDICEEIVKITINAKTSTDIRYDLIHGKYKNIEVKGSDYYSRHRCWAVSNIESFKFNNLFVVCMSSNFEKVERVYIIPNEEVGNVKGITIYKNSLRDGLYEEFRVNEKPYQATYEKILKNDR